MADIRTINLCFIPLDEWWLYDAQEGKDIRVGKTIFKNNFACHSVVDDKIYYLSDIWLDDNDLEFAKKRKEFLEECSFIVFKDNNQISSFKGTFIDALIYIKENFKG